MTARERLAYHVWALHPDMRCYWYGEDLRWFLEKVSAEYRAVWHLGLPFVN